jgi:hypothetical protein
MVVFEFETQSVDGAIHYWIGTTKCTGEDEEHTNEIYDQLDAQTCGLAEVD